MKPVLSQDIQHGQPVIEVNNLLYTYPGSSVPALKGISFNVEKGEVFGLLGPNGAGKTTTLSILSTLIQPQTSKVHLCGIDVSTHAKFVRRVIGFVPQEIALYPTFTIKENLIFFGRLCGLWGKMLRNRLAECLEAVDLVNRGDSLVKHISSGMKRRINIATALMNSPQVLLLDEPTVGVDTQTRKLIFEKLKRLKENGMTMIYTTHYMEDAEQLCDRIIIIDNGECIAEGPPGRLIAENPECKNLEDLFLSITGKQIRE
ncbi:MAG: ABC transporter ATP-binding protein [Desulfatiglans sp.]|jgi:ABC-2 type transport system ATP-binding protein|nr:ABC transporter ATP-binding protein [Desulfatiglans sp.]